MSAKLPIKADEILALRRAGKRPADMILVSMIGWLGELNPCVLAKPGVAYEWNFLVDLSVMLVVDTSISKEHISETIKAILAQQPSYFGIWFADKQDGRHLAWGSYRPQLSVTRNFSYIDKQKYSGLRAKQPTETQLKGQ